MFSIFSRSINTAARTDAWTVADDQRRQRQNQINRREAQNDRAAHLRAADEDTRLQKA